MSDKSIFVATVTIEISDQIGKYETRIVGAFDDRARAQAAMVQIERTHRTRRTSYKVTQVELNCGADWGRV